MGAALDDVLKDWMVEHDPEGVGQLCRDAHNELATIRAQALPKPIVDAVREYQRVWLKLDAIAPGVEWRFSPELQALQVLIEADAKEREG